MGGSGGVGGCGGVGDLVRVWDTVGEKKIITPDTE